MKKEQTYNLYVNNIPFCINENLQTCIYWINVISTKPPSKELCFKNRQFHINPIFKTL
jgi:hypothetical protein